jgi:DNA-binding HxlR family transcriptional regulator
VPVSSPSLASPAVPSYPANVSAKPVLDQTVSQDLETALQIVGDKYSLQIIHLLVVSEAQRFVELESAIQGISPRTLSARLKHLEFHGLITRKAYATIPPKVEYRATKKGIALDAVITALIQWNETYPPNTDAS